MDFCLRRKGLTHEVVSLGMEVHGKSIEDLSGLFLSFCHVMNIIKDLLDLGNCRDHLFYLPDLHLRKLSPEMENDLVKAMQLLSLAVWEEL